VIIIFRQRFITESTPPDRPGHGLFVKKKLQKIFATVPSGLLCRRGYGKKYDFRPIYRVISETMQYSVIVAMEGQQEMVRYLLNCAIFNDLKQPLTRFQGYAISPRRIFQQHQATR